MCYQESLENSEGMMKRGREKMAIATEDRPVLRKRTEE